GRNHLTETGDATMASEKQNQPRRGHNGGADEPMQGIRDQVNRVGEQVREGYGEARERAARGYRQAEGVIARNPSGGVWISFGIGLALGLLLTAPLPRREETWFERYMPDSLRDIPDRLRDVPDSLRGLSESLRDLPEMIADRVSRHLPKSMSF